jgi:heme/copper-type cytochrome/quinol oxidase subunit 2
MFDLFSMSLSQVTLICIVLWAIVSLILVYFVYGLCRDRRQQEESAKLVRRVMGREIWTGREIQD